MKLLTLRNQGFINPVRSSALFGVVVFCSFLFVSALVAVEPGPEADGVYSCGKDDNGKYVELGKLEIKGKTYATFGSKDRPDAPKTFSPFTTDGEGKIQWSNVFNFLDNTSSVGSSEFSLSEGKKPTIGINYGENHERKFMICTKEK